MAFRTPTLRPACLALASFAAALALVSPPAWAQDVPTHHAPRPSAPFKLWYGAEADMGPEINVSTGGGTDPRTMAKAGISELYWAYGTQIGWKAGPAYWSDRCKHAQRTAKANDEYPFNYVVAGIGLDEWVGSKYPEAPQWIQQGLTEGKTEQPDVFIALWANGWSDEEMYELGLDNTIDLYITQGYTKATRKGLADSWDASMRELETMTQHGLGHKSILSLGHITDQPNHYDGSVWTEAELRDKMEMLRRDFPRSPGVAFFGWKAGDPEKKQQIVDMANRLAAEIWPADWLPDGVYAITPQRAVGLRVEAFDYSEEPGATVGLHVAKYPNDVRNQQWRLTNLGDKIYRIQPAYTDKLSLGVVGGRSASGTSVVLQTNVNMNAQKWKLVATDTIGLRLEPLCAPGKYLQVRKPSKGGTLSIGSKRNDGTQYFSLVPEICKTDPIPPVYQLEDGQMEGAWRGSYGWSHTGEGYVNFSDNKPGQTVTIDKVDGGEGGVKQLVLRHANGFDQPRQIHLAINGSGSRLTLPTTGKWSRWMHLPIRARLKPGKTNTITITTTKRDPGDLDAIRILPEDWPTPGQKTN